MFSQPPQLVASALVVAKGHGWFLRRYDVQGGIQVPAFIAALPQLTIQAFDGGEVHASPPRQAFARDPD